MILFPLNKSFNPFEVPTDVNAEQKSGEIVSSELKADVEQDNKVDAVEVEPQAASNKNIAK